MKYDINLFIQSNNQIIAIDESLDGLRVIINKDLKKHILLSKYRNIPKYNCHRKFLKSSRKYDYILWDVKKQLKDISIEGFLIDSAVPTIRGIISEQFNELWDIIPKIAGVACLAKQSPTEG